MISYRIYIITLLCVVFLKLASLSYAQNVGIGVSNPLQRLHIGDDDGDPTRMNLHLDGAFMPGGAAGLPGMVLYSNGANTPPSWGALPSANTKLKGKKNYLVRWTPNDTTLGRGISQEDSIQVLFSNSTTLPTADLSNFVTIQTTATGVNRKDNQRLALRAISIDTSGVSATVTDLNVVGNRLFTEPTIPSLRVAGAVQGMITGNSNCAAVAGQNNAGTDFARGVYGLAHSTSGLTFGVQGSTRSSSNRVISGTNYVGAAGVFGVAHSNAGIVHGVQGWTQSTDALAISSGVYGYCNQRAHYGVMGENPNEGVGVLGWSTVPDNNRTGIGVIGQAEGGANNTIGVYGVATNSTASGANGRTYGVFGWSFSVRDSAAGVIGVADSRGLLSGRTFGVIGISLGRADSAAGVLGINDGANQIGVFGRSQNGFGAYGLHASTNGLAPGVMGETRSRDNGAAGVVGIASSTSGTVYGVIGQVKSNGVNSAGLRGDTLAGSTYGSSWAVWGQGSIRSTGNVVASAKLFQIDHPLEPESKYLQHICPESNEPINIYSGTVTTDNNGKAVVKLPPYVSKINKNFRYQLSCIQQFAQAIVAEEFIHDQFVIQTDKPGVKISWLLIGERNDLYIQNYPFTAEKAKEPSNIGKYVHPQLFKEPLEKGIGFIGSAQYSSNSFREENLILYGPQEFGREYWIKNKEMKKSILKDNKNSISISDF